MNKQTRTHTEADALPVKHFAECELDDPKPFPSWEPSPSQIKRWAAEIRVEREDAQKESQGPPRQVHAQDHTSEEPSSKQM
jgi:hypothetical protein